MPLMTQILAADDGEPREINWRPQILACISAALEAESVPGGIVGCPDSYTFRNTHTFSDADFTINAGDQFRSWRS